MASTTAPTSRSISLSRSPCSRAPGPQARTHSMHSEQTAQSRQRLASATACSSEKPVLTSSQVTLRAAPGRCGICMRAMTAVLASTSSSGLASSIESSCDGEEVLAAQEVVDAARRAAPGGDGLDGRPGGAGGGVAAGEHALLAGAQRGLVGEDLALLDGDALGALEEVVDHALADGEDDGVAVELVLASRRWPPAGASRARRGRPANRRGTRPCRRGPQASVTIGDGMHEQLKAMLSSRPSLSSSSRRRARSGRPRCS